tara:strand:+ start:350 stop:550 length:201 start_codon:yes stop_codon:yes gene_type:complete
MKNDNKTKGNEMTYEDYMKLLEEGDARVREMGRQAREAAMEDMELDEAEEEFVSETAASYMVYGGA